MTIKSSRLIARSGIHEIFAAKAKIAKEDANEIALRVLIALDAAKRSRGVPSLANFLTKHMIIMVAIGSQMRDKSFYKLAMQAYEAMFKAAQRDTKDLDLSTSEYTVIRKAIGHYVRYLPNMERGLLEFASKHAEQVLRAA